jgi:hypothetical protein
MCASRAAQEAEKAVKKAREAEEREAAEKARAKLEATQQAAAQVRPWSIHEQLCSYSTLDYVCSW